MKDPVTIFRSPEELAAAMAEDITAMIRTSAARGKPFSIALSGGSTPELLYSLLGEEFSWSVPWDNVHLFWGDERCVPADHPDSNYRLVKKTLTDKIVMPHSNIHMIDGEEVPSVSADNYSAEVSGFLPSRGDQPVFDLVLLGMGSDGHTASIFPDRMDDLAHSSRAYEAVVKPGTGQWRITVTPGIINNAELVIFIVTGSKKSEAIADILNKNPGYEKYPASMVKPVYGKLGWYIDLEAASLINR